MWLPKAGRTQGLHGPPAGRGKPKLPLAEKATFYFPLLLKRAYHSWKRVFFPQMEKKDDA